MSRIDRYLLNEIALPFASGLLLFFVVIAFTQIFQISDAVTGLGITGADIVKTFLYSLPSLLGLLIPIATLFATMLAVGRLSSDKELLGWAASGGSPYRLLRTPLSFGVAMALIAAPALLWGEAWG